MNAIDYYKEQEVTIPLNLEGLEELQQLLKIDTINVSIEYPYCCAEGYGGAYLKIYDFNYYIDSYSQIIEILFDYNDSDEVILFELNSNVYGIIYNYIIETIKDTERKNCINRIIEKNKEQASCKQ